MSTPPINPITSTASPNKARLWNALDHMLRQHELNTHQMLPASVVSFDRTKNTATVQPMIMMVDMQDKQIQRQPIAYVPVISLGGGGFHISFPLQQGDFGWIYAADRDLSLFLQNLKMSPPYTGRVHNFADSMFVPDVLRKYTINGEDSAYMVIQSTDGATRISIRPDNIKITAPTKVLVDVPQSEFTGNVQIDQNLVVSGNTTITGQTTANGGFESASGTSCTLPANATVGGINVTSHGHDGVQSGSSRTADGMVS